MIRATPDPMVSYEEGIKAPLNPSPVRQTFDLSDKPLHVLAKEATETVLLKYGILVNASTIEELEEWLKSNILGQSAVIVLGGYSAIGYSVRIWFEVEGEAAFFLVAFR